ncbi:hypothetical protein HRAG_02286, partial [Helicobacter bilis ATCC 43879]
KNDFVSSVLYTLYFVKALFVFVKTHISINVIMCVMYMLVCNINA